MDILVSRGLPAPGAERPVRIAAAPLDPVERARNEYADNHEALSSRIIGPDVIDRLSLVVMAHPRGVSCVAQITHGVVARECVMRLLPGHLSAAE